MANTNEILPIAEACPIMIIMVSDPTTPPLTLPSMTMRVACPTIIGTITVFNALEVIPKTKITMLLMPLLHTAYPMTMIITVATTSLTLTVTTAYDTINVTPTVVCPQKTLKKPHIKIPTVSCPTNMIALKLINPMTVMINTELHMKNQKILKIMVDNITTL